MQLTIRDLHKRFGAVEALRGAEFVAEPGEFFAHPRAQRGRQDDAAAHHRRDRARRPRLGAARRTKCRGHPRRARDTAMVFQTFALYPHLSTFDNLAYPLREARAAAARHCQARRRDRRNVAPDAHAQAKTGTRSAAASSSGARSAAPSSAGRSSCLLDEPLTNLDAKLRHDTRAEFKRLHRELRDTTILYATPDQIEALSMGHRIGVLRGGPHRPDRRSAKPVPRAATTISSPRSSAILRSTWCRRR